MENKIIFNHFFKANNIIYKINDIETIDCSQIEQLKIFVTLENENIIILEGIEAIELIMQIKPSIFESKRLRWPRFAWMMHNMIGHPLMNICALFRLYKLAFYIHDITVPKPTGKRN